MAEAGRDVEEPAEPMEERGWLEGVGGVPWAAKGAQRDARRCAELCAFAEKASDLQDVRERHFALRRLQRKRPPTRAQAVERDTQQVLRRRGEYVPRLLARCSKR